MAGSGLPPDCTVHETRCRARREREEYAGWFTAADYESGIDEISASIAKGYSQSRSPARRWPSSVSVA